MSTAHLPSLFAASFWEWFISNAAKLVSHPLPVARPPASRLVAQLARADQSGPGLFLCDGVTCAGGAGDPLKFEDKRVSLHRVRFTLTQADHSLVLTALGRAVKVIHTDNSATTLWSNPERKQTLALRDGDIVEFLHGVQLVVLLRLDADDREGASASDGEGSEGMDCTVESESVEDRQGVSPCTVSLPTAKDERSERWLRMISDERDMSHRLLRLREVYLEPLRALLSKEAHFRIAAKAETTLVFSQAVRAELEATFADADGRLATADMAAQLTVLASSLKYYVDYIRNHMMMEHTLHTVRRTDTRVADLLEASEGNGEESLSSMLARPMTRLDVYGEFVRALIGLTPADDPGVGAMHKALAIIEGLLEDVTLRKKESEDHLRLVRIQEMIEGSEKIPLATKGRGMPTSISLSLLSSCRWR